MESTPEQVTEGRALVTVLACVLEKLIQANANSGHDHLEAGAVTKFHALRPPGIGVAEYLDRILKYSSCSNECFVLGLIYMDRFIQRNDFALTALNVHRVAITSVMVAAKFFDDQYYNNAYYAKVGGVPCVEMNSLEIEFLFGLDFNLAVTSEEYRNYRERLGEHSNCSVCGCSGAVVKSQQPPSALLQDGARDGRVMSSPGLVPAGYASGWQASRGSFEDPAAMSNTSTPAAAAAAAAAAASSHTHTNSPELVTPGAMRGNLLHPAAAGVVAPQQQQGVPGVGGLGMRGGGGGLLATGLEGHHNHRLGMGVVAGGGFQALHHQQHQQQPLFDGEGAGLERQLQLQQHQQQQQQMQQQQQHLLHQQQQRQQ
ncbi:unnamed protein product, partial [Ectocarpus sp. 12 AP-2014]